MKLRKILSSVIAGTIALSAMTFSASAIDHKAYMRDGDANYTVFVRADKENDPNWSADTGSAIDSIYGVTYSFQANPEDIENGEYFGGKVFVNCTSKGWKEVTSWGNYDGNIIVEFDENGQFDVTYLSSAPVFAETDAYAQFCFQSYGAKVETIGVKLLAQDGSEFVAPEKPAEEEAPAEEETTEEETPAEDAEAEEEVEDDAAEEETEEDAAEDDAAEAEVDWDSYDADAMAAMNEEFVLGGNIDIYSVVGDKWADIATIEADFVWTPGLGGWCGGAGIGNGAVAADGSTWISGPEYGAANANSKYEPDGKATQVLVDLSANPLTAIASVGEDGTTVFAQLMVQNWWNGVEAGAQVAAVRFLDADGNVLGELTYDVEAPAVEEAPEVEEDEAPATGDVDASTDSSKGSPDTGVEDVAVVAGLAIVAAGAVLVSKKRK